MRSSEVFIPIFFRVLGMFLKHFCCVFARVYREKYEAEKGVEDKYEGKFICLFEFFDSELRKERNSSFSLSVCI